MQNMFSKILLRGVDAKAWVILDLGLSPRDFKSLNTSFYTRAPKKWREFLCGKLPPGDAASRVSHEWLRVCKL